MTIPGDLIVGSAGRSLRQLAEQVDAHEQSLDSHASLINDGSTPNKAVTTCRELYDSGVRTSGYYWVKPCPSAAAFRTECDMGCAAAARARCDALQRGFTHQRVDNAAACCLQPRWRWLDVSDSLHLPATDPAQAELTPVMVPQAHHLLPGDAGAHPDNGSLARRRRQRREHADVQGLPRRIRGCAAPSPPVARCSTLTRAYSPSAGPGSGLREEIVSGSRVAWGRDVTLDNLNSVRTMFAYTDQASITYATVPPCTLTSATAELSIVGCQNPAYTSAPTDPPGQSVLGWQRDADGSTSRHFATRACVCATLTRVSPTLRSRPLLGGSGKLLWAEPRQQPLRLRSRRHAVVQAVRARAPHGRRRRQPGVRSCTASESRGRVLAFVETLNVEPCSAVAEHDDIEHLLEPLPSLHTRSLQYPRRSTPCTRPLAARALVASALPAPTTPSTATAAPCEGAAPDGRKSRGNKGGAATAVRPCVPASTDSSAIHDVGNYEVSVWSSESPSRKQALWRVVRASWTAHPVAGPRVAGVAAWRRTMCHKHREYVICAHK